MLDTVDTEWGVDSFSSEAIAQRELVKDVQDRGFGYLASNTFHDQVLEALSKPGKEKAGKMVALQQQYAAALLSISGGFGYTNFNDEEELQNWDSMVKNILFEESNPDSLSGKGRSQFRLERGRVRGEFVGATTVLTFFDMWQEATGLSDSDVYVEISDPEVDVNHKIDLKIESDKHIYLFQLKAGKGTDIIIESVDSKRRYLDGKISDEHAQIMLEYANTLREQQQAFVNPKDVQVFAVQVPGMGTVGNVFGRVTKDRESFISNFSDQARSVGLVN